MSKIKRFIPQIYMIFCMTLSISLIHYAMGDFKYFWIAWFGSIIIAAPLAFFFSYWIKPILKKLDKIEH